MSSSIGLSISTFVIGSASILYWAAWIFKKPALGLPASLTAFIGWLGCTFGIISRWSESYNLGIGHAPLSNLYESLVFFSWAIIAGHLIVEYKYRNRVIGAFTAPLAFLAIAYASLSPNVNQQIKPLIPALKSNWLIAHVLTCFIGYAALALSCGISSMYLLKKTEKAQAANSLRMRLPEIHILDRLNYQLILFGFLWLTMGIISGAVWADSAWGRYWGWDPKEVWSMTTWLTYAALLHLRMMRGWRGRRIAIYSIVGFGTVLFTYFGVNYLPGLHSYGAN